MKIQKVKNDQIYSLSTHNTSYLPNRSSHVVWSFIRWNDFKNIGFKIKGEAMYEYEKEKPTLFTDEGQRTFLKIRDHVQKTLKAAGAIRMEEAMDAASGSNWTRLACVDRLVELGEIREIPQHSVAGQHRIFTNN